jgi:tetraacyldisaccharide 4'-kinase
VVVARKRAQAAAKLLRDYPATRLILADDGLQHYALARDAEIAVIAADFGLGNGFLMPAGPLRESASRLQSVDAVVGSGAGQGDYPLEYTSDGIRPLTGGALRPLVSLAAAPLYALTAIARPERFFNSLRAQGAMLTATHSLPDHAAIPADVAAFAGDGNLLISEKDAVKTAAWPEALKARTYVVDYRALLPPELLPALRRKLGV